jgi:hypothetical protein
MKQILLALVDELEDLRANQVVQGRSADVRLTIVEAREAKGLALKANAEFFDNLRKQIEVLA